MIAHFLRTCLQSQPSGIQAPWTGSMARASGFRNVLVHECVEVRDDLVVASLQRTADILAFIAAIAAWLGQ